MHIFCIKSIKADFWPVPNFEVRMVAVPMECRVSRHLMHLNLFSNVNEIRKGSSLRSSPFFFAPVIALVRRIGCEMHS